MAVRRPRRQVPPDLGWQWVALVDNLVRGLAGKGGLLMKTIGATLSGGEWAV